MGAALAKIDSTNCALSTKRALRFMALTASRQVEVRRATWDQVDLESAVWVKPAESMKTGRPHRVPLSLQALDLLRGMRDGVRQDGLVFPGSRPGWPRIGPEAYRVPVEADEADIGEHEIALLEIGFLHLRG